jgi:lipooligosaccharide transport system permease protein
MSTLALAGVVVERNVLTYRRQWVAFLTGFLEPVFYLFSLGLGLGALIGDLPLADGRTVTYAQFMAPAMLAMSAMNGAVFDATYNMFFKLKYMHTFDAMLATPVGPRDIAVGEMLWSLMRSGCYVLGFLAISVAMGLTTSWWAVLALPAATLIGFVFSAVGMAATTWIRNFQDFDYIQMALVPLTLLSATFFPVQAYPASLRWLVELSPLYHGVVIERALLLGTVDGSLFGHVAALLAMGAVGLALTRRRLAALLLK